MDQSSQRTRRDRLKSAAAQLVASRFARTPLRGLDEACRPSDEAEAYEVQRHAHDLMTGQGRGRRIGRKVGCTTPVMQAYLGIPNPCAGGIFESAVMRRSGTWTSGDHQRLGVECEIAVELGADLPADAAGQVAFATAAKAVRNCMAAIEIVEDRYVDYARIDTATLIADDFFQAGCVLGPDHPECPPDTLDRLAGRMIVNRVDVGGGHGRDVLGHPLNSLCWLASSASRHGSPLQAGEIVLLGSLVQTVWLSRGDHARIAIDELGEAEFRIA